MKRVGYVSLLATVALLVLTQLVSLRMMAGAQLQDANPVEVKIDPAKFEGSEGREIVLRAGTPKERRFTGQAYLLNYGLPQFLFHVTTSYALLRHNGVEIGKKDYMGS